MDITRKGKIGQFFCNHKNNGWFVQRETYSAINGETRYKICKDCGKVLDKEFLEYEGMGFK